MEQSRVIINEQSDSVYIYLKGQFSYFIDRVPFGSWDKDQWETHPLVPALLAYLSGEEFYLSETDIKGMISLTIDLEDKLRDYIASKHTGDSLWVASFRELVRLHYVFIKLYLSNVFISREKLEIKNTIEYFILSELTLYGGMFGKEIDEFKKILEETIGEYFELFERLTLGDKKALKDRDIPGLINELLYQSFSTLDNDNKQDALLWGVDTYQKTYYSLLRCVEIGWPALFILSDQSHKALDESLDKVWRESKGKLYDVNLSYYNERPDLIGVSLPDKQGGYAFKPGLIPLVIEEAQGNPCVPMYLVFRNIHAVMDSLRVELFPLLWEKAIFIAELQKYYVLPENLHIIFTMEEEGLIKDEAYLDRVLRQRVGNLSRQDMLNLLMNRYGIEENAAEFLSENYEILSGKKWLQGDMLFSPQDYINIGIYARNRGASIEVLKEELYRYFILRFRYEKDRNSFREAFTQQFGKIGSSYDKVKIEITADEAIVDGIRVKICPELVEFKRTNPGKSFEEAVLALYGYSLRSGDKKTFAQLVRQRVLRESSTSRFFINQGASGEGKTRSLEVFRGILMINNLSYTVHKHTTREEYRGGIFPSRNGVLKVKNSTPFTEAVAGGGFLTNWSEANTSYRAALPTWLSPLALGQTSWLHTDIPGTMEEMHYPISEYNTYALDINPDDFRARYKIPAQIRRFSIPIWSGYDYSSQDEDYLEEVRKEIRNMVRGIFDAFFPELSAQRKDEYSDTLAVVYYNIQKGLFSGAFKSLYQVFTVRDIIRTVVLFRYYQQKKGFEFTGAFKRAATVCLGMMWLEGEPRRKISRYLTEMGLWKGGISLQEAMEDVLAVNIGHILIHSSGVEDAESMIRRLLPPEARYHYISVNNSIEMANLVGGGDVDLGGRLGVYEGMLLKLIKEAELEPGIKHYLIMDNFQQSNPDTAVGLNRALQDGLIEVPPEVASIWEGNSEERRFVKIPANLRIIGVSYANSRPTVKDTLPMSGAELSRFFNLSSAQEFNGEWAEKYIKDNLETKVEKKYLPVISAIAGQISAAYTVEYDEGRHQQIRLSVIDLDEFIFEIVRNKDVLSEEKIKRIAYYTLAIGLRDEARKAFTPSGTAACSGLKPVNLAPVEELLEVMESVDSAVRNGRRVMVFEGPAGSGKTDISEDIARYYGLRFVKKSGYKDIDVWELLGKIEQYEPGKFRLTCSRREEKFLSDFLDILENSGVLCLDEGNISRASVDTASFFKQIISGRPIDLGLYYNGIEVNRHIIRPHPRFYIFITVNPRWNTRSRKNLPLPIEWFAKIIWVTDDWSRDSYLKIIKHYLKDDDLLPIEDRERLIKLHIYAKYIVDKEFRGSCLAGQALPEEVRNFRFSDFRELYTYQYAVSPRELIRVIKMINSGNSLFEGVLLNYFFQFGAVNDLAAVTQIIDGIFPGFKGFIETWRSDTSIEWDNKTLDINKAMITHKGLFIPVQSQITGLKGLFLSLKQPRMHTLINSEQGSLPLETVRFACELTGMELNIFDAHTFVSVLELLAEEWTGFGKFDKQGKAKSENQKVCEGFLGKYLVREDECPQEAENVLPKTILYANNLEVVAAEELEALNDFLNTGRKKIGEYYYVLRPDTRLVIDESAVRKKELSAPFYNRFQKVGVFAPANGEVAACLNRHYPGLTAEETSLIYGSVKLAWYMDMGLYDSRLNKGKKKFASRYGFSIREMFWLAEMVVLEKMRQKDSEEIDSFKTVLKSVLKLYGNGLNDITVKNGDSDRDAYLAILLSEVFNYEGLNDNGVIKGLENELKEIKREWFPIRVKLKDLEKGEILDNGISIKRLDEKGYLVETPANKYRVAAAPDIDIELSPGVRVRIEGEEFILYLNLITEMGGLELALDRRYALPESEVSRGDYISYHGVINEIAAAVAWAARRVEDKSGRVREVLPVFMVGETGAAKSALVRNFSAITGTQLFTLPCFTRMEIDALFGGIELSQDKGKQELVYVLREFFAHLGKINGEYYYPGSKRYHTGRKIIFLDEANVSAEIMYCLRPALRGERKFTVYLQGAQFNVELDPEVIVMTAGNPGRGEFAWEIMEEGLKLWVPALHRYKQSQRIERGDLENILFGMYQRKMHELDQDIIEAGPRTACRRPEIDTAAAAVIKLEKVIPLKYKQYSRTSVVPPKGKQAGDKEKKPRLRKDIDFNYSIDKIENGLRSLESVFGVKERYRYFLDNILRDYLLAVSEGKAEAAAYRRNERGSLSWRVVEAAESIDIELAACLKNILELYGQPVLSMRAVRAELNKLRGVILGEYEKTGRFLFVFAFLKEKKLFMLVQAQEITDIIKIDKEQLTGLGLPMEKYGNVPFLGAYVVERHPFQEDMSARGVFKGRNYALVYLSSTLIGSRAGRKDDLIDYVAYHEIGHIVDNMRVITEERAAHPNIELFEILFPLIFSKNKQGYIKEQLLPLLDQMDSKSYYCQAAKGIFNGFLRLLKEKDSRNLALNGINEISDSFEPESIRAICRQLSLLTDKQIKDAAIILYKDAWKKQFKGEYYLDTAKAGKYKIKAGAGGDSISEITEGMAISPDVEYEAGDEQVENNVTVSSDREGSAGEDIPDVEFEETGSPEGQGPDAPDFGAGVITKEWLESYCAKLGGVARRFIELFSGEPEPEEIYASSGRKLVVRRLLTLARKIFRKTIYEESSAALTMVIIVDVSGSVTGNNQLVKFFTNMAKYFVSLLYLSGRNNPNVHSALYAIGETLHRVYSLDECRDEERLRASPQELWEKNDYGGINTLAVLNGLRKVFLQSPAGAPKVYFVHTDGQETSGQSFSALREMAVALEEELGAVGVFVGVGTDEVKNYHRYILLSSEPNDEVMMRIIMKVGMHLVDHGSLPRGNLIKELGIEEDTGARADGGSKWNFSPEEIETIERQNRREYAKAAFGSLSEAGVITADNFEQVRALLLAITEGAGEYASSAYNALGALSGAGAITADNLEQVSALFRAIAKGAGGYKWNAYKSLGGLAEAGAITTGNLKQVSALFLAIAERAWLYTSSTYRILDDLAKAVKEKELNPVVLDLKLLLAIAERAEIFVEAAYEALGPLAKNLQEKDFEGLLNPDLLSEAITGYLALQGSEVNEFINLLTEFVTGEEGLIRANFQKRFEQYVYRMAFYKKVSSELWGVK
ncbi:MAG: AAA family ATPase [Candidatus Omnitrophota bacterium]